jgi:hypothetical protein
VSELVAVRVDFSRDLAALFEKAGLKTPYAVGRAIDEVGNKTKTIVIRSVAKQAGVRYGKAKGVINARQAMGAGGGRYEIVARDVTLSLKEFGARATKKGVVAAPWGKKREFPHAFIGPNGHVFVRMGKAPDKVKRLPIHKMWGPNIPKEMVKEETEAAFFRTSAEMLGPALEKWLLRQIG